MDCPMSSLTPAQCLMLLAPPLLHNHCSAATAEVSTVNGKTSKEDAFGVFTLSYDTDNVRRSRETMGVVHR